MKILYIILSFLLVSCQQPAEEDLFGDDKPQEFASEDTSEDSTTKDLLYWPQKELPLKVKVSQDLPQTQHKLIKGLMDQWNTAADKDVFKYNGATKNKDVFDASDYRDKTLGIYFANHQNGFHKDTTLAMTLIYATETTLTNSGMLYTINHADIVLNNYNHVFSINQEPGTYDLESVIIHELGHLAGIVSHSENNSSVMKPILAKEEVNNQLFQEDMNIIASMYGPNLVPLHKGLKVDQPGKVLIIIELKTDGKHVTKMIK